jgi:predicted nicotinamide N-methyase
LSKYFANKKVFPDNYWATKRAIEVGSGTGLCGIALSVLGADTILTDQANLLPLLQQNANANKDQNMRLDVKELSW